MSHSPHISSLPKNFSKSEIVVANPPEKRRSTLSQKHIPLTESQIKRADRSGEDNTPQGHHCNPEDSETDRISSTKENTYNDQVASEIMLNIIKTQKGLIKKVSFFFFGAKIGKKRRFHEAFNRFCQHILKTNSHLNSSVVLDLKVFRLFLYTIIKNVRLAFSHEDRNRNLAKINDLLETFENYYKLWRKALESAKASKQRQNRKPSTEKSPRKGFAIKQREEKKEESLKINGFLIKMN